MNFIGSWTAIEATINDFVKQEILYNDSLRPADTTCSFSLVPDLTIYNYLRGIKTEDIPVRIYKDSVPYFYGYIRKTFNIQKTQRLEPVKIECVSPSFLLKRKIGTNISYTNLTVTQVLTNLLTLAGITSYSLPTISSTLPGFMVVAGEGETYYKYIQDILYEYGYTFYFDEEGEFVAYNLVPVSLATTKQFDGTNCLQKIEQVKKEEAKEEVIVEWTGTRTLTNSIVFSDTTNAQSGYKCYIEVPPNGYLGGKEEWYAELDSPEGEIITVATLSLDWLKDSAIVCQNFVQYGNRVLISIQNTDSTYSRYIRKFDIVGGIVVVKKDINKSIVIKVSDTEKIEKYESKYLYTKANGDHLANLLAWYYAYADFTYKVRSRTEYSIGDIVIVTEAGIGTNTARVRSKKSIEYDGVYEYECDAIDEYVPDTADGETTVPTSPIMDVPVPDVDINQVIGVVNPTIIIDSDDGFIIDDTSTGAGTQITKIKNNHIIQQYFDGDDFVDSIVIGSPSTKNDYQINIKDRLVLDPMRPVFYKETLHEMEGSLAWSGGTSSYHEVFEYNGKLFCFFRSFGGSYYGLGMRIFDNNTWGSESDVVVADGSMYGGTYKFAKAGSKVVILYFDSTYHLCYKVYDLAAETLGSVNATTETFGVSTYFWSRNLVRYGSTFLLASMKDGIPDELKLWQLDVDNSTWTTDVIATGNFTTRPQIAVLSDGTIKVLQLNNATVQYDEYTRPAGGSWSYEALPTGSPSGIRYDVNNYWVEEDNTQYILDNQGQIWQKKIGWSTYVNQGYLPDSDILRGATASGYDYFYDGIVSIVSFSSWFWYKFVKEDVWNTYKPDWINTQTWFWQDLDNNIRYFYNDSYSDYPNTNLKTSILLEWKEYSIVNAVPSVPARALLAKASHAGNGFITADNQIVVWGQKYGSGACSLMNGAPTTDGTYTSPTIIQKPVGETGTLVRASMWGITDACALYDSGNFYTCGRNSVGELGLGDTTARTVLTLAATDVVDYREPQNLSYDPTLCRLFIKKSTGKWYGAGYNVNGALGLSDATNRTSFTLLNISTYGDISENIRELWNLGGTYGSTWIQIDNNKTPYGVLFVAGHNSNGQLGLGSTTTPISTFTDASSAWGVSSSYKVLKVTGGFSYFTTAAVVANSVLMLISSSSYIGWVKASGYNAYGALGDNTVVQKISPVTPNGWATLGQPFVKKLVVTGGLATVYCLTIDNKLYTWGYNGNGQCGVASTTTVQTPTEVTISGETITDIFADQHGQTYSHVGTAYLQTESGKLYGVGINTSGNIGDGTVTQRNVFTPIDYNSEVYGRIIDVAWNGYGSGTYYSTFLTDRGYVFGLGYNGRAGLSMDGTLINKSVLTLITPPFALAQKGDRGKDGVSGSSATIEVGTVTVGDSPEDGSVTNSGNEFEAVFDFVLPKGDPGTSVPDLSGLTESTSVDPDADYYLMYDVSSSSEKKIIPANAVYGRIRTSAPSTPVDGDTWIV